MNIYSGISSLDSYGNPKNFIDEDNVTSIMQVKAITFILSPKIIDDYESKKH